MRMPNTTTYPVMTMDEMEQAFDQEWVLIIDPSTDRTSGEIKSGEVAGHDTDRDVVEALARELLPPRSAVWFIGKHPWDGVHLL